MASHIIAFELAIYRKGFLLRLFLKHGDSCHQPDFFLIQHNNLLALCPSAFPVKADFTGSVFRPDPDSNITQISEPGESILPIS